MSILRKNLIASEAMSTEYLIVIKFKQQFIKQFEIKKYKRALHGAMPSLNHILEVIHMKRFSLIFSFILLTSLTCSDALLASKKTMLPTSYRLI